MKFAYDFQPLLDFWFGKSESEADILVQQSSLWWGKDASVDKEIETRFGASLDRLMAGQLNDWKQHPRGYLSMIILADQFSRNIYRDSAMAFAQDEYALGLTLQGIRTGIDLKLSLVQRVFFYLPLEHSESLLMQNRSVDLFRQVYQVAPVDIKDKFKAHLDYAIAHRQVIEKYGRYPHRNALLGRQSSPEEIDYLKQPGSGF